MTDAFEPLTERLRLIREESPYHWAALVVAIVLGLGLSTVHWVGLVAGGALVGLVAASLRRALLAGLGFGLLALAVWVVLLVLAGSLGEVLATGQLAAISVAIALVGPVFGSLARGVV
jgi:hypothetical protein